MVARQLRWAAGWSDINAVMGNSPSLTQNLVWKALRPSGAPARLRDALSDALRSNDQRTAAERAARIYSDPRRLLLEEIHKADSWNDAVLIAKGAYIGGAQQRALLIAAGRRDQPAWAWHAMLQEPLRDTKNIPTRPRPSSSIDPTLDGYSSLDGFGRAEWVPAMAGVTVSPADLRGWVAPPDSSTLVGRWATLRRSLSSHKTDRHDSKKPLGWGIRRRFAHKNWDSRPFHIELKLRGNTGSSFWGIPTPDLMRLDSLGMSFGQYEHIALRSAEILAASWIRFSLPEAVALTPDVGTWWTTSDPTALFQPPRWTQKTNTEEILLRRLIVRTARATVTGAMDHLRGQSAWPNHPRLRGVTATPRLDALTWLIPEDRPSERVSPSAFAERKRTIAAVIRSLSATSTSPFAWQKLCELNSHLGLGVLKCYIDSGTLPSWMTPLMLRPLLLSPDRELRAEAVRLLPSLRHTPTHAPPARTRTPSLRPTNPKTLLSQPERSCASAPSIDVTKARAAVDTGETPTALAEGKDDPPADAGPLTSTARIVHSAEPETPRQKNTRHA